MPALTLPTRALRRDSIAAAAASDPIEQDCEVSIITNAVGPSNTAPPEKDPNRHPQIPPRGTSASASVSDSQDTANITVDSITENTRPRAGKASNGRYSMLSLSGILRDRENITLSRPAPTAIRTPSGLSIFLPRKFSTTRSGKSNISGNETTRSYRLKTFSFEDDEADAITSPPDSPEPELVVMPNKGGLQLEGSEEAQARNASSSYTSEAGGARSPGLTVSPPIMFGRRILSSLEAYGFSNPHFASLGSSNASADVCTDEKIEFCETKDGEKDTLDQNGAVSEGEGSVVIIGPESSDAVAASVEAAAVDEEDIIDITSEGTLRRHPPRDGCQGHLPEDSDEDSDSISTRCLPRASANLDRVCVSMDSDNAISRDDYYGLKSSFPRSAVSGLKHRFSNINLKAQPVKVKKWFVRQFRASRKGSRVIVKKVRERRARRKVDGANASANGSGKKSPTKLKSKRRSAGSMKILRPASLLTMFSVSGTGPNNQTSQEP